MHVFDAGEGHQVIRLALGQWPQGMLADNPVARQVTGPGLALAPGAEFTQHRQLCPGQLPGQLGLAIDLVGVDLAAQVGNQFGAVLQDPGVLVVRQLRAQAGVDLGQVQRILGGIADLGFRQRALQPVRAGLALGQFDTEHFLDQARITHGEPQVQVRGGQLGVEQRRRQAAGQAQQDFEVFTAGMHHLDHRRVLQQGGQGLPVVDGQGVDQVGAHAVTDLDQPRDGIEGVDPHEFGVEGNEG